MKNPRSLIGKMYLTIMLLPILILGSKDGARASTTSLQIAQSTVPSPSDLPRDRRQELPDRPIEPLPSIDDLLESPTRETPTPTTPPDSSTTFEIEEFKIKGNTAISNEEIQARLKKYLNRPLTFAELLEIETDLTKLYRDRGYINSGALVPRQNVSNKVINVQIVEGIIEDVNVTIDGRLNEDYVRSRLKRGTKNPLNINELQEALQLLQLNPLIENLNAELAVGSRRDRWVLDVDVNQANAFRPLLFINNSRTPSVGSFQRGIEITHNNLAGFGDRFGFIYKNTDGSNDFDFNYNVPFNSLNGTVGVRYRFVNSDIIEPPFDDLDIESETDEYQVTLRQPVIVTASSDSTQELALGVEFSRQANKTTLENEPFPLSAGADEDGETRISALRLFQDWTRRTRQDVFAARSQFSVGVDLLGATINEDEPDSSFFSWRGQVQWLRQLNANSNINLLIRSDIQLSASDLVPLEQFSLGGIDSVRGYRQDSLLGDSGIFTSAEVRIPVVRWSNGQSSLSAIPFVDVGTAWGSEATNNQDADTLVSLGVGLQLLLNENLRARLDWGIPLIEVDDRDRTLQEDGIYFSVEYLPF
jgi:hemolysin activation/secretion protein